MAIGFIRNTFFLSLVKARLIKVVGFVKVFFTGYRNGSPCPLVLRTALRFWTRTDPAFHRFCHARLLDKGGCQATGLFYKRAPLGGFLSRLLRRRRLSRCGSRPGGRAGGHSASAFKPLAEIHRQKNRRIINDDTFTASSLRTGAGRVSPRLCGCYGSFSLRFFLRWIWAGLWV